MQQAAQLAGFIAAHAVLQLSRGKGLTVPLVVLEKQDGNAQFIQATGAPSQEEAVRRATQLLRAPAADVLRGVLAFEAYLNVPPGQKTDAILIQACQYPGPEELYLGVPFRPAGSPDGFAVFRPKFIAVEGVTEPTAEILEAFLRGVSMHPPGHDVWVRHLDESR
jgi:hypothetical protein